MQHETNQGRGDRRRKPGRKKLPADEKQGHRVMVNFKADEYAELQDVTGGESLSAYIRELVLRHLARLRRRK